MHLDKMYFIGFRSKIAREEMIDVPPAPINFKDPIKIQERLDDNMAKVRPLAEVCPGISTVEEIHVYNYIGKSVFWATRQVESPFNPPAVKFWQWLDKTEWCHFRSGHTLALRPANMLSPDAIILGPAFFGFRIQAFFSMIALEAIHHNHAVNSSDEQRVKVPVQIWRDHVGVVDPYNILFTPEQRKIITLDKAIQLLFGVALDLESLYQNPRKQAILAHRMTQRGQLLGTAPEEDIGYSSDYERKEEDPADWGSREEGTSSGGEPGVLSAAVQSG